jgi:micrococcal nuclease
MIMEKYFIALLLLCFLPLTASAERLKASVIRVVDGDTLQVEVSGQKERVRLIGVDTPETKHPKKGVEYYGKEAFAFAQSCLSGRVVWLEFDVGQRDRYRRLLAYVWLEENEQDTRKMFNSVLLIEGYAQLMTIPPNVKYVDQFRQYQTEARENKRGLWR